MHFFPLSAEYGIFIFKTLYCIVFTFSRFEFDYKKNSFLDISCNVFSFSFQSCYIKKQIKKMPYRLAFYLIYMYVCMFYGV